MSKMSRDPDLLQWLMLVFVALMIVVAVFNNWLSVADVLP